MELERHGRRAWSLIGIGVIGWFALRLIGDLRVVVLPLVVATFLTVALWPLARWLRDRGLRPLLATWIVFAGFLGVLAALGFVIVPAMAEEFGDLGPTLRDAYADVTDWLVEDSPFDIDRDRLEELEEQASDAIGNAVRGSGGAVVRGALLLGEVVTGLLLSLVLTFFFLKDGTRFAEWGLAQFPEARRDLARRLGVRAWATLGAYLRGSALLGLVEAVIIGVTLAIAGAGLVVPVALVTFAAAFVPFVGAITAGVLAVAVALATAGPEAALAVAIVALVVQQLDSDLLGPWVFGRALDLHPVIVLLAVTAGGTLFGLAGAFLGVPVTALVINLVAEARADPAIDPAFDPAADG